MVKKKKADGEEIGKPFKKKYVRIRVQYFYKGDFKNGHNNFYGEPGKV